MMKVTLTRLEQAVPNPRISSSSSLAWFCPHKLMASVWAPCSEKRCCYVPTKLPAFFAPKFKLHQLRGVSAFVCK
jgi:hypothetical protein